MSWGLLLIPWVLKHLQDGFDQIECYIPSSLLHLCSGVFDFQNLAHLFVKLNNGSKEKVNHTIEFLKTFSFPSFSFCLLETHGYVANSTVGYLPIFFIFIFLRFRTHVPFYFLFLRFRTHVPFYFLGCFFFFFIAICLLTNF
jgi:hypothetical protein